MRRGLVLGVLFAIGAWCAPDAVAAAPTVTATPITATEGQQFSGSVATLSPCTQSDTSDQVTLNWGDNTAASAGAVMSPAVGTSQCEIAGTHTFAEEGSYPTQVTVTFPTGGSLSGTSSATVADAPINLTARSLSGTAGSSTSGTLATLQDSGALEPGSDYMVTIGWGDGQSSAGAVDAAGDVAGSHTYASAGTYSATVTVGDAGGQSAHTTIGVSISSPSPPPCVPTTPAVGPLFTPTAACHRA